jgi:hypothetical protein
MKYFFPIFLLLATSSFAQIWEPVVESENQVTYSYDSSTVKREGDIVTYWELVDYSKPLKSGNLMVISSKSKIIQDCKNNRFKVADLIDYDGHKGMGNIVNIELARTTNWYQGTPESVNEALKDKVCKL